MDLSIYVNSLIKRWQWHHFFFNKQEALSNKFDVKWQEGDLLSWLQVW